MNPNYPDATRIWQRVRSPEPLEQQSLQALMRQLGLDMAYFKQLSKGNDDRSLAILVQDFSSQIACLKGLLLLSGGSLPRSQDGNLQDHSLTRCYDHALTRLGAYRLRASDPVYGPVFQELARQTEQHCRLIVELLGRLPNPKHKGHVPAR